MFYILLINNNHNFSVKSNVNEKFYINQIEVVALNKTTALLQDVWSAFL